MPYARYLVCTDFSTASESAARVARSLAGAPSNVTAIHVLEPLAAVGAFPAGADLSGAGWPLGATLAAPLRSVEAAHTRLARWVTTCGLAGAHQRVLEGRPVAEMVREARAQDGTLLILGATGHSAFERVLLGTTTHAITRDSTSDVLIVRDRPEGAPPTFRRIVVATDFNAPAHRAARAAADIARLHGAEVILTHVIDRTARGRAMEPPDSDARLHALNNELFRGEARELLIDGRPSRALRDVVSEVDADLLVVGDRGPEADERMHIGSVAGWAAEHTPSSVLVVKSTD